MSNHLYKPVPPTRRSAAIWAVPATLLFAVAVLCLNFIPRPQPHANWNLSPAHVSATRITTQGFRDASQAHPAEIYYRGEANVTYTANGEQYTLWLPATSISSDREWLAFRLSRRKDDSAEVKWNPSDPSQAEATLHLR
jgi:hypothetical protein